MSLNGLQDEKLAGAYSSAVAEAGGWFLLKYSSRDEVDLLDKGNGGIIEMRNAIAKYEEASPLYGFLRYRRRNVVLKYVPEGCSRLVQARVAVHFGAITEHFSPHDTTFSITTTKELRDTTLSAACSLHTASGSSSSSTSSLRRRRLMEIAEESEEDRKRQSTVQEERPPTAKSIAAALPVPSLPPDMALPPLPLAVSQASGISYSDLETTPPPPRESYVRPQSPVFSIGESKKSSQSARPEMFKQKIKLGPRPSPRPSLETSPAKSPFRPVSTLPLGLKTSSKLKKEGDVMDSTPETPEPALLQARPHTSNGRPTTSSGVSVKSMTPTVSGTKLPAMTPEKARLMKAMAMRKKQMSAAAAAAPMEAPALPLPVMMDSSIAIGRAASLITPNECPSPEDSRHNSHTLPTPSENELEREVGDIMSEANKPLGTGSDLGSPDNIDESDATRDSCPASPAGPSEHAQSTEASSVSGSTDGIVHKVLEKPDVPEDLSEEKTPVPLTEQFQERSFGVNLVQSADEHKSPVERDIGPELAPETRIMEGEGIPEAKSDVQLDKASGKESAPPTQEIDPSLIDKNVSDVNLSSASRIISETEHQTAISESAQDPDAHVGAVDEDSHPLPNSPSLKKNEARNWKVPRSKFSTHDIKTAARIPVKASPRSKFSTQGMEAPAGASPSPKELPQDSQAKRLPLSVQTTNINPANSAVTGALLLKGGPESANPKLNGDPSSLSAGDLDAVKTGGTSENNLSSDDEFMDELQDAVFEEAKPMAVSKSPMSPVFPRSTTPEPNSFARSISNPQQTLRPRPLTAFLSTAPTVPGPRPDSSQSTRSVSAGAAFMNRMSQQPSSVPLTKKVNVGSAISQRIKALEKLSSQSPDATSGAASPGASTASSSFFSVRKSAPRPPSRSPSIVDRASSLIKANPNFPEPRDNSPESVRNRDRAGSVHNRLEAFNNLAPAAQPVGSQSESISVTAHIVRDPNQPHPSKFEAGKDPLDYKPLKLQESPLVIDHQRSLIPPNERETILERRASNASKPTDIKERKSSITLVKDLINSRRSSVTERRQSTHDSSLTSIMRSPSRPSSNAAPLHKSMSIVSLNSNEIPEFSPPPTSCSTSPTDDEKTEKSSRASRMLRRMSSSLSAGRKTLAHAISPTVREESEPASAQPQSLPTLISPTVTRIDEVNVQFPDTLLWKRRYMALDSQGLLVMSPALAIHKNPKAKANLGATRKFHLTEFTMPAIPDPDMGEMPNSIVMHFLEGSELQIACESRASQRSVLKALQEAHQQFASNSQ